jgi:hypothetical protein
LSISLLHYEQIVLSNWYLCVIHFPERLSNCNILLSSILEYETQFNFRILSTLRNKQNLPNSTLSVILSLSWTLPWKCFDYWIYKILLSISVWTDHFYLVLVDCNIAQTKLCLSTFFSVWALYIKKRNTPKRHFKNFILKVSLLFFFHRCLWTFIVNWAPSDIVEALISPTTSDCCCVRINCCRTTHISYCSKTDNTFFNLFFL